MKNVHLRIVVTVDGEPFDSTILLRGQIPDGAMPEVLAATLKLVAKATLEEYAPQGAPKTVDLLANSRNGKHL